MFRRKNRDAEYHTAFLPHRAVQLLDRVTLEYGKPHHSRLTTARNGRAGSSGELHGSNWQRLALIIANCRQFFGSCSDVLRTCFGNPSGPVRDWFGNPSAAL